MTGNHMLFYKRLGSRSKLQTVSMFTHEKALSDWSRRVVQSTKVYVYTNEDILNEFELWTFAPYGKSVSLSLVM